MPAPFGNQNAVGNNGGRPCLFDKQKEFNELFEWAKTDKALVMRAFAPMRGYSFRSMEDWAKENVEFLRLYNMSKELIGARREELLIANNSSSPFQRYATYYDSSLRMHEKEDSDNEYARKLKLIQDEAKLKAELGNQTPEETKEQLAALLDLISSTQSSRKIDANKSSTDIKS